MDIFLHHIRRSLLLMAMMLATAGYCWANTVKQIKVSADSTYTDHIALKDDSNDMDLIVKIMFNEGKNTLSLSIISYRSLFVFQSETLCSQIKSIWCWNRRLKTDKLPFVVSTEPDAKYYFSKQYWKTLPKPKRKHIFHKWLTYPSSDLQPIPTEYKMVNEFITQEFNLLDNCSSTSITLGDIMMLEKRNTKPGKPSKYDIIWGKDLQMTYNITIERDPCFGLDKNIQQAQQKADKVKLAYGIFMNKYGNGTVRCEADLEQFNATKKEFLANVSHVDSISPCPKIQSCNDSINMYLDKIKSLNCSIAAPAIGTGKGSATVSSFNVGFVTTQARRIDDAVSRWLISKDKVEKGDLIKQCEDIIAIVQPMLESNSYNASQQKAVNLFRQAVSYYKKTCKQ